ncbi:MAG: ABC transporter permease subunit [Candidatus Dormibacteraeota bacterium]|nr:ABC transporter permease subunit [Candidatus Dormibacteraeota bacterium]
MSQRPRRRSQRQRRRPRQPAQTTAVEEQVEVPQADVDLEEEEEPAAEEAEDVEEVEEAFAGGEEEAAPRPASSPGREGRPTLYERWWATGLPNAGAIAGRELASIFTSPIFYVVAAGLTLVVSIFSYLPALAAQQPFTMGQIFALVETLMVFLAPLITMRLLSEERRTGTLEMLLTSPVRDWEVVVGKWLGGLVTYLAALTFTVVYVILISVQQSSTTQYDVVGLHLTLPNVDYGAIVAGYLGELLVGGAWVALGLLASSLTSNQIVAAVIGICLLLILYIAFSFLPLPSPYGDFFNQVNASTHAQSFHDGRLVLGDVVYFLTLIVAPLFLATRVLESRRWR